MDFGQKIYKSKSTRTIKLLAVISIFILLLNLYFQTFYDPAFMKLYRGEFLDVINFHMTYPYDALSYLFFILLPFLYYSFLRGNTFFENVVVINRGLPFYNKVIKYKDLSLIHISEPTRPY